MKRTNLSKSLAVVMTVALALVILGVSNTALATVDSVSIAPGAGESYSIPVGGTVHLTGSMVQSDPTGTPIFHWDKSNDNINFDDPDVTTTTITGIHAGTTVVTLSGHADNDATVKQAQVTITVNAMTISNTTLTLDGGATYSLTAGNVVSGSVTWSSSDSTLVTVDAASGVVTAVGATLPSSPVTITATSDPGGSADVQTKTCQVTVNPTITLTPSSQNITAASTAGTIQLKVEHGGALISSASTVAWSNGSTSIGSLSAPTTFTDIGSNTLICTATFTSSAAGTSGTSTITATISGAGTYTKALTATVTVRTNRYLTLDGPSSLNKTTRTGTYTVNLHEADGTIVDDDTSTVHWSWTSSYLSLTSDDLNDRRADMHNGEAHIQLYARYNTPSTGTKLYVWINDASTGGKIYHTITITGLSSLPQTGQDFTLAYVFGGLSLALLVTAGVLYGIRKKRTGKA